MSDLPNSLPRPPGERAALEHAWRTPAGWRFFKTVNNTRIGLLYIGTALLFFILAGILGLMMRAQLAVPENDLLSAASYNQVFTMHGTVMMFLFAIPMVEAIAVYLLPNMLGARDLPFPRLSAYAYWAYAIGGLAFFCTLFAGLAPDGGWFMYPPLTGKAWSPGINTDFWLLGIGFIEISAIAGAVELIVGILFTRAPGMTLGRMPVFAWAMLVVAFMVVFAFPAIIAGTALLELERAFDWPYFIPARGGDPLLWQHLFWFFGHPEVYIISLPAAGLVSTMVPALAGTPLVGRHAVAWAIAAVGALSFLLWAHHMFTAGLGIWAMSLVSAASMAVAVPTAVQVFSWIATIWRGQLRREAPALFILGFLFIFVLGGLTGVMVAVLPFDWQVHDTYFVVAHLHYVLIGGLVFPMIAAVYYWIPHVGGQRMSERLARWAFWLMFGGFNLAFFPMHISGLLGMPRRVYTYAPGLGWDLWNLLSSCGAAVLALGILLFMLDLWRTLRKPGRDPGNPWQASSLEWLPSADYGTRSIPRVDGPEPLWERPQLAREVEDGRHYLPGTATGGRETIVTSLREAQPRYLLVLPTDSWLPLLAAAGTAGFFLLLTVKLTVPAWACAAAALAATLAWLWQSDRAPPLAVAAIGDKVVVPVGAPGKASVGWWGLLVTLVVDATIFASFLFTYLHVSMLLDICPPPGARLPGAGQAWTSAVLLGAGSALVAWLSRQEAGRPGSSAVLLAALACTAGSFALDLQAWHAAGLAPTAHAWSAAVAVILSYQGLHVAIVGVMALYTCARAASGLLTPQTRATLDHTALAWHAATLQGLAGSATIHWLPRIVG